MEIRISEQIGIGDFGDHADGTKKTAAQKYAEIIREEITTYCEENYPEFELKFDLSITNVSSCCRGFEVNCDSDCNNVARKIEMDIKSELRTIVDNMEQTGEIYEN